MGLEDESARLKWYQYQNKRYGDYLKDWFKEKVLNWLKSLQ